MRLGTSVLLMLARANTTGALDTLLGDCGRESFFTSAFGRKALQINSAMSQRPIFGWKQLNDVLNSQRGLPVGAKFLGRDVDRVPVDHLVALRELQAGSTLFLEDVDRFDATLGRFLSELSAELRCRTRFNLYLSSPGIQGRGLHYDSHDVFVLQIEGSKRWSIFELTDPNPLDYRKIHQGSPPTDQPAYLDVTLRPGDVLYVPRGHWHSVLAVDEVSLHLTLGVFFPHGIDFLTWLVDECTENELCRQNFPLRLAYVDNAEFEKACHEFVKSLAHTFHEKTTTRTVVEDFETYNAAILDNRAPFNLPFSLGRPEFELDKQRVFDVTADGVKVIYDASKSSVVVINRGSIIRVPSAYHDLIRDIFASTEVNIDLLVEKHPQYSIAQVGELLRGLLKDGLIR